MIDEATVVVKLPPCLLHRLYNDEGVFSSVDLDNPDRSMHPAFHGIAPISLTVDPGDMLFIPVGWWHDISSLSFSVSLTFVNFHLRNAFRWDSCHVKTQHNPA